jgi:hypothetical protein
VKQLWLALEKKLLNKITYYEKDRMSIIQFRIYENGKKLDRHVLLDIFHLGNFRVSKRINSSGKPWWKNDESVYEVVQDYYHPIETEEILCEYIEDQNEVSDGFVVYLNHDDLPRSYSKANLWLTNIHDSHIEIIEEYGWGLDLYIGKFPQRWLSKKFLSHAIRLNIKIINHAKELIDPKELLNN